MSLSSNEPVAGHAILTLEGTQNGSFFTFAGGSGSVPLVEGPNAFTFWAMSSWGDSSQMGSASQGVDTQTPGISGGLTGTPGDGGWYVSNVDVSASASDPAPGSGIASVVYSLDGGSETGFPGSITVGEGIHSIVITARDGAGHSASITQNVSVDTASPGISIDPPAGTAGMNGWFVSDVTLGASAADPAPGSGLAAMNYSLDGSSFAAWPGSLTVAEGVHTLIWNATDAAGNSSSGGSSVSVDYTPPLVDLAAPSSFCPACGQTVGIGYSASDGLSGMNAWSLDAGGTTLASGSGSAGGTYVWDGGGLAAGNHTLTLQADDLAGNAATATLTIAITDPVPEDFGLGGLIPPPVNKTSAQSGSVPNVSNSSSPTNITPTDNGPAASGILPEPAAPRPVTTTGFGVLSAQVLVPHAVTLPLSDILWGAEAVLLSTAVTSYVLDQRRKRNEEAQRAADEQARREAEARAKQQKAAQASSQANAQAIKGAVTARANTPSGGAKGLYSLVSPITTTVSLAAAGVVLAAQVGINRGVLPKAIELPFEPFTPRYSLYTPPAPPVYQLPPMTARYAIPEIAYPDVDPETCEGNLRENVKWICQVANYYADPMKDIPFGRPRELVVESRIPLEERLTDYEVFLGCGRMPSVDASKREETCQTEGWTYERKAAVYYSIFLTGYKTASRYSQEGVYLTPDQAFRLEYEDIHITFCTEGDKYGNCSIWPIGGFRLDKNNLIFWSISGDNVGMSRFLSMTLNIMHENGHIDLDLDPTLTMPAFDRYKVLKLNSPSNMPLLWQQHSCELDLLNKIHEGKEKEDHSLPCWIPGEIYADLFIAELMNAWDDNPKNKRDVEAAQQWIRERLHERTRRIIAENRLGEKNEE